MKAKNNTDLIDLEKVKSVRTYAKSKDISTQAAYIHIKKNIVDSISIDGKKFVVL